MRFALIANLRALRNQRGEALRNLHRFAGAFPVEQGGGDAAGDVHSADRIAKLYEVKPLPESERSPAGSAHGIEFLNVTFRYHDRRGEALAS